MSIFNMISGGGGTSTEIVTPNFAYNKQLIFTINNYDDFLALVSEMENGYMLCIFLKNNSDVTAYDNSGYKLTASYNSGNNSLSVTTNSTSFTRNSKFHLVEKI